MVTRKRLGAPLGMLLIPTIPDGLTGMRILESSTCLDVNICHGGHGDRPHFRLSCRTVKNRERDKYSSGSARTADASRFHQDDVNKRILHSTT